MGLSTLNDTGCHLYLNVTYKNIQNFFPCLVSFDGAQLIREFITDKNRKFEYLINNEMIIMTTTYVHIYTHLQNIPPCTCSGNCPEY